MAYTRTTGRHYNYKQWPEAVILFSTGKLEQILGGIQNFGGKYEACGILGITFSHFCGFPKANKLKLFCSVHLAVRIISCIPPQALKEVAFNKQESNLTLTIRLTVLRHKDLIEHMPAISLSYISLILLYKVALSRVLSFDLL